MIILVYMAIKPTTWGLKMKLHKITAEQARFIWMRAGTVYKMQMCVTRELPVVYTSEDYINGIPALAEKRVINEFARRDDYPQV